MCLIEGRLLGALSGMKKHSPKSSRQIQARWVLVGFSSYFAMLVVFGFLSILKSEGKSEFLKAVVLHKRTDLVEFTCSRVIPVILARGRKLLARQD